jgi:hypothetical protein
VDCLQFDFGGDGTGVIDHSGTGRPHGVCSVNQDSGSVDCGYSLLWSDTSRQHLPAM